MQAIAEEFGGSAFEWATQPEDRSRLWKARHDAYYAAMALQPGTQGFATDACVPISRLADCMLETKADIDRERARRAHRRPRRRRQLPPRRAVRPERSGAAREGGGARQAREPARDRDGRHLHRRARHRRAQARSARRRAGEAVDLMRIDQARARPAQHHESGQDGAARDTVQVTGSGVGIDPASRDVALAMSGHLILISMTSNVYPLHRQQELLVVVAARLARGQALGRAVSRSDGGAARRSGAESGQPRVLALCARAVPARRRRSSSGIRLRSPSIWPSGTPACGPPIAWRAPGRGASPPRCIPDFRHCATK